MCSAITSVLDNQYKKTVRKNCLKNTGLLVTSQCVRDDGEVPNQTVRVYFLATCSSGCDIFQHQCQMLFVIVGILLPWFGFEIFRWDSMITIFNPIIVYYIPKFVHFFCLLQLAWSFLNDEALRECLLSVVLDALLEVLSRAYLIVLNKCSGLTRLNQFEVRC